MEVRSQPGMASYRPSDVQNKVKQTAALGFRVKSGWAVVVLLTRQRDRPQLAEVSRVELSDARLPETRQPYHATMGKLETDSRIVSRRERLVRRIAQQSLGKLHTGRAGGGKPDRSDDHRKSAHSCACLRRPTVSLSDCTGFERAWHSNGYSS